MFIVSILAMVALPTYTDYRTRAKVSEGFKAAAKLRTGVEEYYFVNGVMPEKNEQLGLHKRAKKNTDVYIERIRISSNPKPGTIKLFWDDVYELPELDKKNRIDFVPQVVNGRVRWDCTRGNMLDKYRPVQCRGGFDDLDEDDEDD